MSQNFLLKKSILMAVAVGTVAVPMFLSAAIKQDRQNKSTFLYAAAASAAEVVRTPEALYERLKNESRKMCGSTDVVLTGSIERVMGNESCYEGTLNAAVERLDNPDVSAIHAREVSQL